jgi:site-specific recombinase XerD
MDDYEQYEQSCQAIRQKNQQLLNDFSRYLKATGLSDKTVNKHVSNTSFYINEFLLYDDVTEAQDGIHAVGMYFGYWFIKKAMWATPSTMKSTATSLKKFYGFLAEQDMVSQSALQELKDTLKEGMPDWIATLKRYDDPDILDMDEVWGL